MMNDTTELSLDEMEQVNGGLSRDDFREGVKEFFSPPEHMEEVMWP